MILDPILIQPRDLAHEQNAKILLYTVNLLFRPFPFTLSIPETRSRVKYDKAHIRRSKKNHAPRENRIKSISSSRPGAATKKPLLLSLSSRFHTYFSFFPSPSSPPPFPSKEGKRVPHSSTKSLELDDLQLHAYGTLNFEYRSLKKKKK